MIDRLTVQKIFGEDSVDRVDFLYRVVDQLPLSNKSKVLDIGTGRGVMAIALAAHGYSVLTGEPEGHKWADWKSPVDALKLSDKIKFQPFEAESLPFEDTSFDGIFLFGSLHHIDGKQDAFNEFNRILRDQGILCVIEFTEKGIKKLKKKKPNHPDMVDPRNYAKAWNAKISIVESELMNAYIFHKTKL